MKNLFKIANWCVVGIIVEAKNIVVNYKFDARFDCTCSHRGERMKKHMKKQICNVLDLPVLDKETRYDIETIQFRCPQCGKFHTPRPALFSVRRSEFLSVPAEIKELICGNRYLLLKSPEKLSVPAQEKLALLLKSNETLNKTYLLKEQFRAIFKIKDALEAQLALVSWIKMAFKSGISRVQKIARKIELHFRQIANAFVYKVNSGKIEATNATLKRIISKACGVSDVDYLFLKLKQHFYFYRARFYQPT